MTTLAIGVVVLVAIFLLALRNTFDDTDAREKARDMTRRIAATVRQQLDGFAQKGHISEQMIVGTLREHQSGLLAFNRDTDKTVFVAEVLGYATAPLRQVDVTTCFEFTVLSEVDRGNVTYRELEECPPRT